MLARSGPGSEGGGAVAWLHPHPASNLAADQTDSEETTGEART